MIDIPDISIDWPITNYIIKYISKMTVPPHGKSNLHFSGGFHPQWTQFDAASYTFHYWVKNKIE